jgi:acetate kinase
MNEPANPHILTINGGSSSIKVALFETGGVLGQVLVGVIERIGLPEALLRSKGTSPADNFSHAVAAADQTAAVALFCYQVKKWIGAFAAALGGLDTLVFAGGIGENAPTVRTRICDGLGFLGIELDEQCNYANAAVISREMAPVAVRVMHTDEEVMIANSVCRVLNIAMEKEYEHGQQDASA